MANKNNPVRVKMEAKNMKNVEMRVNGNILTVTVDLAKRFGKSSSGKSIIIASTEGNQPVPDTDGVKIGLNIYTKAGQE